MRRGWHEHGLGTQAYWSCNSHPFVRFVDAATRLERGDMWHELLCSAIGASREHHTATFSVAAVRHTWSCSMTVPIADSPARMNISAIASCKFESFFSTARSAPLNVSPLSPRGGRGGRFGRALFVGPTEGMSTRSGAELDAQCDERRRWAANRSLDLSACAMVVPLVLVPVCSTAEWYVLLVLSWLRQRHLLHSWQGPVHAQLNPQIAVAKC